MGPYYCQPLWCPSPWSPPWTASARQRLWGTSACSVPRGWVEGGGEGEEGVGIGREESQDEDTIELEGDSDNDKRLGGG